MLREFPSKGGTYEQFGVTCCKSYRLLGWSTVVPAVADDGAPAQLITLIFFMNWCYT